MNGQPSASTAALAVPAELSRGALAAAMAIGSIATAVVVSFVPYLPTNDGPQHVLSGVIQKAFSEPGTRYGAMLEPLPEFAERGFSILYVPLLEVLSWQSALRVALVVVALSGAWAFAALACAVARRRTPWALLGFALAFPWTLYMGFLPFVVAASVGVGVLAFAVAREEPRRVDLVALSAMLLVDAVLHVGVAAATGLVVALLLLLRAPSAARLRALGTISLVGAPAAAVLVAAFVSMPGSSGPSAPSDPGAWALGAGRLVELPRYILPGPMPRALAATILVVAGLATGAARARRREASHAELALLIAATLFLAGAVLGPLDLPGWQRVAPRLASLATPLAVALLAPVWPGRDGRASHLALGVVVVLTGASLGVTSDLHRRLSRGCAPALAGLSSSVDLTGFTLPLPLDAFCGVSADPRTSEVPHLAPLFHVGALYAAALGGFTPYMFSGTPAVHAFRYRPEALRTGAPRPPPHLYLALVGDDARTDPAKRDYLVARFAEYGMVNDHLLVVGAKAGELASILARGFVADWQSDSAMIAHARPCALDVLVEAPAHRGVFVEIGLRPAARPVFAMPADRAEDVGEGVRRLRFPSAPCGPVWVRGFLDVDGSGSPTKGDAFCDGASREGDLDVEVGTQAEVRCRIHGPARPKGP